MPDLKQPQINNIIISGRLTADPEMRMVGQDNQAVCNTSIAVDDGWGDKKKVFFLDCTFWGKTAEIAAKLHKGSPVVVEGRLGVDEWDDKSTGHKRTKIVMTANRVHGLAWDEDGQAKQEQAGAAKGVPF